MKLRPPTSSLPLARSPSRPRSPLPPLRYGFECVVEPPAGDAAAGAAGDDGLGAPGLGPYAADAMLLFDYRTDHLAAEDAAWAARAEKTPTFMYAMPLSGRGRS